MAPVAVLLGTLPECLQRFITIDTEKKLLRVPWEAES